MLGSIGHDQVGMYTTHACWQWGQLGNSPSLGSGSDQTRGEGGSGRGFSGIDLTPIAWSGLMQLLLISTDNRLGLDTYLGFHAYIPCIMKDYLHFPWKWISKLCNEANLFYMSKIICFAKNLLLECKAKQLNVWLHKQKIFYDCCLVKAIF